MYGTFTIGGHRMLRMTSITGECCGFGRDQLIQPRVRLAPARGGELTDVRRARARLPADSVVVVVPDSATGTLIAAWLEAPNASDALGGATPKLVTLRHSDLTSGRVAPDSVAFIALPMVDYTRALQELSAMYVVGPPNIADFAGYRVAAYRMTRRRGTP